jgi:hypothetical protein
MLDEILNGLKRLLTESLAVWEIHGISITGYYLVCTSYIQYPLFENLIKNYRNKLENSSEPIKIFHVHGGNYMIIHYKEPVEPAKCIKEMFDIYATYHNKLCEIKEDEKSIYVIIKPYDEINGYMIEHDLINCGFQIIETIPFIIACAEKATNK